MLRLLLVFHFLFQLLAFSYAQGIEISSDVKLLALGDSYTIGESVAASERWPVQFATALEAQGVHIVSTKIVATTGWRTDNLIQAINQQNLMAEYNLVGLLIGVNNQYQHRPISQYYTEFEQLLIKAIELAQNDTHKVFVISIPDYAYTPYGQSANPAQISAELDIYNHINDSIAAAYHVPYTYITDISRQGLAQPNLVANDGLHPSGQQYSKWVERLMTNIILPQNVSIQSTAKATTIKSIPNPVKDQLIIELNQKLQGNLSAFITDLNGKTIATLAQIPQTEGTQINLSALVKDLPSGGYVIQLQHNGSLLYSNRLIKE